MYKLAIVPKVTKKFEYSTAFGSQHDYSHIKKCLQSATFKIDLSFKIIYESKFFKNYKDFDGVLFLGLSNSSIEFITSSNNIDKFTWSFNQCEWIQNYKIFDNISIVFEQSTRKINQLSNFKTDIHFLPLGFQSDHFIEKHYNADFDIVFNGTLYRNRRPLSNKYRKDIIEMLLNENISVINYNGRSKTKDERDLLSSLSKYNNFKVLNSFGTSKHYHQGYYSLDLPFLDTGIDFDPINKYGMNWYELENTIWLNHWDIFRSIGSKCNIITFDSPHIKSLGLSNHNAHFYKANPENLSQMADEILTIVKQKEIKMVDHNVWNDNTYRNRWDFMINKIRLKISIAYSSQK